MDPLVLRAGKQCGFTEADLLRVLPAELTLWVDPDEVAYRIGEEGSIAVLYESSDSETSSSNGDSSSSGSPSPSPQDFSQSMTSPSTSPSGDYYSYYDVMASSNSNYQQHHQYVPFVAS
jgi:protein Tob/BTG